MTAIRKDVVDLLTAGHSDSHIARQLGVDARATVARARAALGLPKAKPGCKAAASPEDLFRRRTKPTNDGHLLWTGSRSRAGAPSLRHGGRNLSAYRIAFRIANGREPEGKALPTCDRDGCVQHVGDRQDRAREKRVETLYTTIFGAG
ncbi:hypothetical protein ACFV3N_16635 [Streptomyces bauhiniae]|uniref:hypothetical protein n=1 Tax=Streptomyces bauhiniae TaxID=2340725 RepID=UPI003659303A